MAHGQNQEDGGLAPGYYWVRSRDKAYPGVFIAEWNGDAWQYFGTWSSDELHMHEVLSPRLEPPEAPTERTWSPADIDWSAPPLEALPRKKPPMSAEQRVKIGAAVREGNERHRRQRERIEAFNRQLGNEP